MQYETLRGITKDCYSQHFDSLHHGVDLHKIYDDMEENDYVEYEGKFKKELIINSINKNELCTVTLQFYKVPDDDSEECVDILDIIEHKIEAFKTEWRLYTANCKVQYYGDTKGILLEMVSVEKTVPARIIKVGLDDIMHRPVNNLRLLDFWQYFIDKKISIQVSNSKLCF